MFCLILSSAIISSNFFAEIIHTNMFINVKRDFFVDLKHFFASIAAKKTHTHIYTSRHVINSHFISVFYLKPPHREGNGQSCPSLRQRPVKGQGTSKIVHSSRNLWTGTDCFMRFPIGITWNSFDARFFLKFLSRAFFFYSV